MISYNLKSAQSAIEGISKQNQDNAQLLDLKSELCALKTKNLEQDQKRRDEITAKSKLIQAVELKLKDA